MDELLTALWQKQQHSTVSLNAMTNTDLLHRLRLIDSPIARRTAFELWRMIYPGLDDDDEDSLQYWLDQSELILDKHRNSRQLIVSELLSGLTGMDVSWLERQLNRMRRVRFARLVDDDPKVIKRELLAHRPVLKLITPVIKLDSSRDLAAFMFEYRQCLLNPAWGLPFSIRYFIVNVFGFAMLVAFAIASLTNFLGITAVIVLILILTGFVLLFQNDHRTRHLELLALYISFTDEFVDNESGEEAKRD